MNQYVVSVHVETLAPASPDSSPQVIRLRVTYSLSANSSREAEDLAKATAEATFGRPCKPSPAHPMPNRSPSPLPPSPGAFKVTIERQITVGMDVDVDAISEADARARAVDKVFSETTAHEIAPGTPIGSWRKIDQVKDELIATDGGRNRSVRASRVEPV